MKRLFAIFLCVAILAGGAQGNERQRLGYGRLLTNDLIGDGKDRWRTGSYASSRVWGPEWQGVLPATPGQVLEFRFGGEIIAPENISAPAPGDRPFAGVLSFGLHTHFNARGTDVSLGADLAFTGPQTGLDDFQSSLHDALGVDDLTSGARKAQIDDDIHPTLVAESGRDIAIGPAMRLRPFAELRWGLETLVRAGADLTFGRLGAGELMVRAPVTGQRYRVVAPQVQGLSFVLGADIAHVEDTDLLPDSRGVGLEDTRKRVRAGLHWDNGKRASGFYGLTWLDKEFKGQRDSQVVGSLRLKFEF